MGETRPSSTAGRRFAHYRPRPRPAPRHLRLSRPAHSLNPRITTHFAPSSRLTSRLHERIRRSKCAATCIEFLSFHLGGNANAQHKKFGPLRPCCAHSVVECYRSFRTRGCCGSRKAVKSADSHQSQLVPCDHERHRESGPRTLPVLCPNGKLRRAGAL